VYAAEEQRPAPAPKRRWRWRCWARPMLMTWRLCVANRHRFVNATEMFLITACWSRRGDVERVLRWWHDVVFVSRTVKVWKCDKNVFDHCMLESGVTTCKGWTIRTAHVYSTHSLFIDFHHTFITYAYNYSKLMTKQLWGSIHTQITFIQRRYCKTIIHVKGYKFACVSQQIPPNHVYTSFTSRAL
jgi:hypothetical protein